MLITNKVKSIICTDAVKIDKSMDTVCYKIEYENGMKNYVFTSIPKYRKPYKSDKIIDEAGEYVNGFKVVKLANNHYSYIREKDGKLMPYEYDVAFDFNEYGLALVGKAGSISWINKDFNYLNNKVNMVSESKDSWKNFEGWQAAFNFSGGANPLSRLYCGSSNYGRNIYIDTNENIKHFYQYDGNISKDVFRCIFFTGTDFNENGYAVADNFILESSGFCISKEDLPKLSLDDGYIDLLFMDAKAKFQDEGKKLKKNL